MRDSSRALSDQGVHDPLTGLISRGELLQRLERTIESARTSNTRHAFCYMDLDRFGTVGDTGGQEASNEMLRQLAGRLGDAIRQSDTFARLGHDEFGLLLEGCPREMAVKICGSLRQIVEDFDFTWESHQFRVGISMGIVSITGQLATVEEVLDAADSAFHAAKEMGGNRTYVYQEDDSALVQHRGEMRWVHLIQHALEANRFRLYSQPIVPLGEAEGPPEHREILLRLEDEDAGLVVPAKFLPAASRHHMLADIDQWVIQHAFALLQDRKADEQNRRHTINLSAETLGDEYFPDFVIERLERYALNPSHICFDIAEHAAISRLSDTTRFITKLRELGCSFALDHFGSDLSTFAYLKNLPLDYIKISGSLVRDVATDPIDHTIVKSIHEIAKQLGIRTVATHVENQEILDKLKAMGIDFAQGYAIAEPEPLS